MKFRTCIVSAVVLAPAAVATPALAADYDPPIFVEEAPEYVPVEVGSGWYIRGDIGYIAKDKAGRTNYRTFDPTPPGSYADHSFDTNELDTDFAFAAGFGYHFNDWLRADLTAEGLRGRFNGTTSSGDPCLNGLATTTCRTEDGAKFSAMGVMANGYVDLGTYAGFTPYVGAGLGYTLVRWKNLNSESFCVGGDCTTSAAVGSSTHGGDDSWRFTYALMAGVGYEIAPNLTLDLGYKYRNIDGGNMYKWNSTDSVAGASGFQGRDGGLKTHEIKVGLRYDLW